MADDLIARLRHCHINHMPVGNWICGEAANRIEALSERLEIAWATDGNGKRIPFPEGMPDGIACRDETIKLLEQRLEALTTPPADEALDAQEVFLRGLVKHFRGDLSVLHHTDPFYPALLEMAQGADAAAETLTAMRRQIADLQAKVREGALDALAALGQAHDADDDLRAEIAALTADNASLTASLAGEVNRGVELEAEVERLRAAHESERKTSAVSKAFHDLAVGERNRAWWTIEGLKAELATEQAAHDATAAVIRAFDDGLGMEGSKAALAAHAKLREGKP